MLSKEEIILKAETNRDYEGGYVETALYVLHEDYSRVKLCLTVHLEHLKAIQLRAEEDLTNTANAILEA